MMGQVVLSRAYVSKQSVQNKCPFESWIGLFTMPLHKGHRKELKSMPEQGRKEVMS